MEDSARIRDAILVNKETLAARVMEKIWKEYPQLEEKYSETDKIRCREDVLYHISYLADAAGVRSPELFLHYAGWVKTLFHALGVSNQSFLGSLDIIKSVLTEYFPEPDIRETIEILDDSIKVFPSLPTELESSILPNNPHFNLASAYLQALLSGNRDKAVQMIMDSVEGGTAVKELYLDVFQPAQQELGRLWQLNKISVAQEHYCTAATQLIMSQLYPYIFNEEKNGTVFLGACVGGELHEIGIRMLTDILEMGGWDTYFLGANTPVTGVLQSIQEYHPNIIGISATMIFHVHKVEEMIRAIREDEENNGIKILVGGYPFNRDKELWKKVGADGFAQNADEANIVGSRLLKK